MSKPQFTFKNYLKELKKSWLLLAIFFVIGAGGGAYYAFRKTVQYTSTSKIAVHNEYINGGGTISPYAQLGELISSTKLVIESSEDIKEDSLSEYETSEKTSGVFKITATSTDEQKAINTANTVAEQASAVIGLVYEDAADYHVTILEHATEAEATVTTKSRIVSIAVSAVAALALAMIVIFIKFDYSSEK